MSLAVGSQNNITDSWAPYDIYSPEGIKIEVKTSAYLQSWGQKELSKLNFGIQPTHKYDVALNKYEDEVKRQSDIYVFCVQNHKQQETLDPLDLNQWSFYVLSTEVLNNECGNQRTIGIAKIKSLGAVKCDYSTLSDTINSVFNG